MVPGSACPMVPVLWFLAVDVALANFVPGTSAQAWQLTAANAITRLADIGIAGASLSISVPAQSITLLVIPTAAGGPPGSGDQDPPGGPAPPGSSQDSGSSGCG